MSALSGRATYDVTQDRSELVVLDWETSWSSDCNIFKHLYLTSALYVFFLVMCIAGLLEWQKAARRTAAVAA